jgi:trimethylamine---corrinoid protein Co-methyltransferase
LTVVFGYLTEVQRQDIAAAAVDLLEHVGVRLEQQQARELLHAAGARIEGVRVRLPATLIEAALRTAPPVVRLYDRTGRLCAHLDAQAACFGGHTDGPDVLDPLSGQRRPCLEEDVTSLARLVDAMPNLVFLTASGMVGDRPAQVADRVAVACCLTGSVKPILSMPVTLAGLRDCHAMAAHAVGGVERLRDAPLLVVYAEPVSPLVHPDESMDKLLYCAQHRIPVVYSGYAAMGGTAPMAPAAVVVQLCAESLTGLVVHQLAAPGAPFIFGGMASIMDMRTTIFAYGAPEFVRGNTLMVEMAHHFNLPCMGTAGTSDAQMIDGQALTEATSSCLIALLAGAGLVHDVGLLGSATVVMPEMIVATNEIVGMLRRLVSPVSTDDAALAVDVIADVGPGGAFLAHPHTLDHFREAWYSSLFYRGGSRRWTAGESKSFEERVKEATQNVQSIHHPQPLSEQALAAIEGILQRAERETVR